MMRISSIELVNFRLFKGAHSFDIKGNLIFFVGENNTGKSSVFEAVNFVKSGLPKDKKISDIKNKFASESENVTCKIKLTGDIKQVITDFSEKKYEKYVFDENGCETLLIQRSSEEKEVEQGGKAVKLDIKKVQVWNPETTQFENPSGIDSVIGTLFETQFVWADTDPSDVADFGSTKICGRLLAEAVGDFFECEQWKKFAEVHKETFQGEGDSFTSRAKKLESEIQSILENQYGQAAIKFDFSLPDTAAFFKSGDIFVDDGTNTRLKDKGTGMQRAVALALIQVCSQQISRHPDDKNKSKPLFFFIDEPEICLHPKAQKQLLDALITISKTKQIFISTHSPYLITGYDPAFHQLFLFIRSGTNISVKESHDLKHFTWGPTWGEINYFAYNMPTKEFHNELYGCIQETSGKKGDDFDNYLVSKGLTKTKQWVKISNGKPEPAKDVTLLTFIRHKMHHPENSLNCEFSESELRQSIEFMLNLL